MLKCVDTAIVDQILIWLVQNQANSSEVVSGTSVSEVSERSLVIYSPGCEAEHITLISSLS